MLTRLYSPRKNREDGFTLIELLIVVIIIGILAAIALPIFLNQQKAANDGAVQSDVRNTVDSVQTFLIAGNPSTAIANTGAYVTAGGKATISNGDTVGVNIGTDGSYQVCGYVTSGSGNQYKSASAAYTYTTSGTAAGTFATGSCTSGSDTGGSNGAQAAPAGPTALVSYNFNDGTIQGWTQNGYQANNANATIGGHQALRVYSTVASSAIADGPPAPANYTSGKTYTITANVYLVSGTSITLYYGAYGNTNPGTLVTAKNTWTPITMTYTATSANGVGLVAYVQGNGSTLLDGYIDDVTVTPTS